MSKHTPGPWHQGPDASNVQAPCLRTVRDAQGMTVAFTTDEAATQLIAAAPDLLAALHAIKLCEFNSMSSRHEMVRIADAAIAKATGEQ